MIQDLSNRIEQKYLFPSVSRDTVLAWLDHACTPDPLHPLSSVSSLYYDTPGLFHFHESRNGEFLRAKVRLRWYSDTPASPPDTAVRCYLEIKTKQGALSEKQRREVALPSRVLYGDPFSDEQILDLPAGVYELGYQPAGMLVPMLIVEYRRRRYVDAHSRSSISVDTEIRCSRANQRYLQGMPPAHFQAGVLETKAVDRRVPGVLNPIAAWLTKSPFSKYGISLETLMQPLGRRA